jgi:hypothetical protein
MSNWPVLSAPTDALEWEQLCHAYNFLKIHWDNLEELLPIIIKLSSILRELNLWTKGIQTLELEDILQRAHNSLNNDQKTSKYIKECQHKIEALLELKISNEEEIWGISKSFLNKEIQLIIQESTLNQILKTRIKNCFHQACIFIVSDYLCYDKLNRIPNLWTTWLAWFKNHLKNRYKINIISEENIKEIKNYSIKNKD